MPMEDKHPPLKLELLAVVGVSELQDVSLGGGEGLQLLGRHHVPGQIGHLGLDLPLALNNRVTPLLCLSKNAPTNSPSSPRGTSEGRASAVPRSYRTRELT